jgi:ketosteroid isomerase-like protein
MNLDAGSDEVAGLLLESDVAFAAGDADAWSACFAEDGRIFLLHRNALEGRAAIRDAWLGFFARNDTSAWEPLTDLVDVHGADAYVFRTYTERLVSREDGSRTLVRGRLVYFLRREPGAGWRIRLLMNSHSHPMEPT